ncbi:MAG: hypothetical protein GWP91_03480 [Rhodobacterales bacterium]|nr:hypothetical protein [Rhodobacterales bacterium]
MTALALLIATALNPAHALPPGPYAVGTQTYNFTDANYTQGFVKSKLYYPATSAGNGAATDLTGGPYPLAAFVHGWLGNPNMYDGFCTQLASLGFVVASIDTQTGLVLNMDTLALDTVAMLQKVEDDSNGSTWLTGAVSTTHPWSAMGHSMGGGTLGKLAGLEPRIQNYVAFMPYEGETTYYTNVANFTGNYLVITGNQDTTAPTAMGLRWFANTESTARSLYYGIEGAGHQAVSDFEWGAEPMSDAVQLEMVSEMAADFLMAEVFGEEERYEWLTGPDSARFPAVIYSLGTVPALWAHLDGDVISLGITAGPDDTVSVFFGTAPGSTHTVAGTAALDNATVVETDLLLVEGILNLEVDAPAEWTDDLWVIVQVNGTTDSRPLLLLEGEPEPEETEPPVDEPTQPGTTQATDLGTTQPHAGSLGSSKGCSTGRLPFTWSPLLLLIGFIRRSRAT